ncbi:CHAT domain-containing protein [Leptothoe spongobia]|uniref:CHAT domain-containing protein n=1 Tax=Leptothoe spongobia TAU-MAC 1115 TaxID=1967444 RepID=A0A947GLC4_9CYAN|nr:CHAT domain-containing protein [Leptothoe spongobia]MBT9317127.1 CHAT domain-containing protein [Leptothoe spongobia TAU-MAC 1115]
MLQEFDISITAVGNDRYLVRTEQVAPGVPLAQEQFYWPIDDWLNESSTLMHDPLLGILKGESSQRWASKPNYRSGHSDDEDTASQLPTLVSLGQALYNSLFDKALRDSWLTAQGVAQNRRSPLRLRLGLKGEKLQKLPWEVLHAGDRPLGTGTDVTFSRYHLDRRQGYDRPVATVPDFEQPLRVLMVIAAPNDQDRLELAREAKHLQNELHPVSMRSGGDYDILPKQQLDVQLTVLEQPGRGELTQALEQGNYQVLHYAGHSNLGNAGGDLYLVSRQTGLTERISGEDLAGLLSNNGVKLAVLNSCRGAYAQGGTSEVGWHEQNLAHALVNRGIPGVIAMAERIPDDVAITFTQLLYRNLKQGNPIDLCLNRTRQGLISAHGSHYSYWALPILYMQPGFDGYLASKPGNHNSALDKLLSESESALEALRDDQSVVVSNNKEQQHPQAHVGVALEDADLDNVVETLELEEILIYNEEDASTMTKLVEDLELSQQPSTSNEDTSTDVAESLIPETLETPGLELDPLPQSPVPSTETDGDGATIYDDHHDVPNVVDAPATQPSKPIARRRNRQVVMGMGALVLVALAGVAINDPLNLLSQPALTTNPTRTSNTPPDIPETAGIVSGNPEQAVVTLTAMAAQGEQNQALDRILELGTIDDPTLLFSKGQLQWDLMNQSSFVDNSIGPSEAARSWQDALDVKANWIDAQVALGFAYYEQGNFQDAIAIWEDALDTGEAYGIPILSLHDDLPGADIQNAPMTLHAQLGLAMAYYQESEIGLTDSDQRPLLAVAADYWQAVMKTAEEEEVPISDISVHWLWSERALADWNQARTKIENYLSQAN